MQRQPRRFGCLGQLLVLGMVVGVGFVGVVALTNPWIFTVGGRLRLLPFWQGVGDIQGPGGAYRIFLSLEPSNARSHVLPSTSVSGTGWVCAPFGHDYPIRIGGGAHEVVWRDMNGKSFALYTWTRGTWSSEHRPPKLSFVGRWIGPQLVMDDGGTTASAFMQDGSLNPRPGARGPKRAITFVERQWWFRDPCPAPATVQAH